MTTGCISATKMSTSDGTDLSGGAAQVSYDSNNTAAPTDSIWKTRLQKGQFRLFNIELDESDEIRGFLEAFEHSSAPIYSAQSYVCGEGACDVKILVNGTAHYIKPNLYIALRQTKSTLFRASLPHNEPWTQTTWLWIDAICIHQSNIPELEMQIRFMEHIYRGASSTFVSLGEWTESQRFVIQTLEWLNDDEEMSRLREEEDSQPADGNRARTIRALCLQQALQERELESRFGMSAEELEIIHNHMRDSDIIASELSSRVLNYGHPFWQACIEVFESDWFSRLWTFQEFVLSSELLVTLPECVTWHALEWLQRKARELKPELSGTDRDTRRRYHHFLLKSDVRSLSLLKLRAHADTVAVLVMVTAQRRAKVPKDHVFAVLGLTTPDTQALIEVDYSKTDAEVFQEFVEVALRTTMNAAQNLVWMWDWYAWVPNKTPGLPSWCPDLNNDTDAPIIWRAAPYSIRDASETLLDIARLRVQAESGLVFLNVLEVDVVSTLGGGACPAWDFVDKPVPAEESLAVAVASENETLLWFEGVHNALLCGEHDTPALILRLRLFLKVFARLEVEQVEDVMSLMAAAQLLTKDLTLDDALLRVRQGPLDSAALAQSLKMAAQGFRMYMGGTHIFTTVGGRIGYSTKPVSPGDRICIAPSGNYLYVFTPAPSRYVSCAAVHGFAEDDVLDFLRETNREWEEIAIH